MAALAVSARAQIPVTVEAESDVSTWNSTTQQYVPDPISWNSTLTLDSTNEGTPTESVHWTWVRSRSGGAVLVYMQINRVNTQTGVSTTLVDSGSDPGAGTTTSGTVTLTDGHKLRIRTYGQTKRGGPSPEWAGDGSWAEYIFGGGELEQITHKIAHLRFRNPSTVPIKYRVEKTGPGGTFVIDVVDVPALTIGDGIKKSYKIELQDSIQVYSQVAGVSFNDGVWVETDPEEYMEENVLPGQGEGALPSLEDSSPENPGYVGADPSDGENIPAPSPEQVANVPTPEKLPDATATGTPDKGSVWKDGGADGSGVTNTVYRQGVDKITTRLDEMLKVPVGVAQPEPAGTPQSPVAGGTALPGVTPGNLIPETPTFFSGSFGDVTTVTANLVVPGMLGVSDINYNWQFDMAEYSTPISLVRLTLSACLVVGFFILCVKTARGSSAD